jgi:hypothetical protein
MQKLGSIVISVGLSAGVMTLVWTGSAAALGGGCVDSPENPSILLALVGGASALLPFARRRWFGRGR